MNSLIHELSADLVGFWKTQTIYAAVKLGVIDALPNDLVKISTITSLNQQNCLRLLRALWELNIVTTGANKLWELTPKGQLLAPSISSPMAAAAEVWANSHYMQWQSLSSVLQNEPQGKSNYFSVLAKDADLLNTYQTALSGYAKYDYEALVEFPCWKNHKIVLDVGGGHGILLSQLLQKHQHLSGILIEMPEVVAQLPNNSDLSDRIQYKGLDFFTPWNITVDAILFSRVLHDWPDDVALELLNQGRQALLPGGKIYILEIMLHENSPNGGLLDLNMLVMTGGCERTFETWQGLIEKAKLKLTAVTKLSDIVSILIIERLEDVT